VATMLSLLPSEAVGLPCSSGTEEEEVEKEESTISRLP
jgi:hypothetical protein